jgi:hypothetical protein
MGTGRGCDPPAILAGGYGFDHIIGVTDITEKTVHDAGGLGHFRLQGGTATR